MTFSNKNVKNSQYIYTSATNPNQEGLAIFDLKDRNNSMNSER